MKKLNWSVKMIMLFVVILSALMLFKILFAVPYIRNREIEKTKIYQEEIAQNIAREMNVGVDRIKNRLSRISTFPEFRNMNINEMQKIIMHLKNLSERISTVAVLDSEGVFVCGSVKDSSKYAIQSYADSSCFTTPFDEGKTCLTPPYYYAMENLLAISICIPIESESGERAGVLIGGMDIYDIIRRVADYPFAEGQLACIIDKEGTVVAHSNIDLFALEEGPLSLNYSKWPIVQAVMNGEEGGSLEYTHEGSNYYGTYSVFESNSWGVVVVASMDSILAGSKSMIRTILFLNLLFFAIAMILTIIVSRKITAVQRKAEEILQESEERLRIILNNVQAGVVLIDAETHVIEDVNPMASDMIGLPKEKIIGNVCHKFICPAEKGKCPITDLGQSVDNSERILITAGGESLTVLKTVVPLTMNGRKYIIESFVDITKRKKAEEALKEREGLLSSITTSAQDGIIMLDNDGNVVFWNGSAEKIFGYKDEEITGKNFHDILVPAEFHEAHRKGFSRFKKTGKGDAVGASLELEALHKNGLKFPVELSLSSMKTNDQWHSVGIIRDITERKVAEEKLEEAIIIAENANRAKSEFLANMSHEIRTPMNSILGFAEILEEQLRDNPRNHDYIKGIRNSGKSLLGLINDLLDLSKIEAGKLDISYEPINPFTIIEEVRQIFSVKTNKKKLDFYINIDPKLPKGLIFDETRLRQVLFNLIGNAVKFTGEGGITVNVKSEDSNAEGSHVDLVVEVIDTGIGIPENEQQIIFEPFRQKEGQSTRKYGGTGLGLSITQRLVKIMGGTIDVKSTPGRGSAFTVFLPGIQVSALSEINPGQDEEMLNISFQNPLILLVEDIESNRKVIRGYLRSQNINIVEAENGSIGIEKAKEHLPDLILMDMQMPVMDGYEATRVIKSDKELKDISVVALTASTMKRDATEIARLCDGYLRKPVSKSQLLSELKKFLPHSEEKQKIESSADQEDDFFHELKQRLSGDNDIPDEFTRVFNYKIIPEYHTLVKNRSNKRIRNFADLTAEAGRNLNMEMIEAYGNELHAQVSAFNVQRINSMLSEFEELTKVIKEVK